MRRMLVISVVLITAGALAAAGTWTPQSSGVTATFRGVSAVNSQVAWASGSRGTVVRTADGGATWKVLPVPGGEKLDFRDVDAIDADTAFILSIGNGEASRIFKTTDAGVTWTQQFVNTDADGFYDAMAFWDGKRGIAFSDSANAQFRILRTDDGGATWTRVPVAGLPAALENEGAFAASGTNVAVYGDRHVWIGTGAAATSRVLHSADRGKTWSVVNTPIPGGPSAGIYSIAFRDSQHGIIVGGDYSKEDVAVDNAAVTSDGGKTWTLVKGLGGFRSVVACLPGATPTLLAVGPSGADLSTDDGRTWTAVPPPARGLHTYSHVKGGSMGWAAGGRGQIARFDAK